MNISENESEKVKLLDSYHKVAQVTPSRALVRNKHTGSLALIVEISFPAQHLEAELDLVQHLYLLRYMTSAYTLCIQEVLYREDKALVVMDYPRGGSLRSIFKELKAVSKGYQEAEIWCLLTQLCEVVSQISFLYTSNILQFNPILSPDTLFYNSHGRLQLDLIYSLEYYARMQEGTNLLPSDIVAQLYRDIEILISHDISEKGVTYSVGIILFEAATLHLDGSSIISGMFPCYINFPQIYEENSYVPYASARVELLLLCERWRRFFSINSSSKDSFQLKLRVTPYLFKIIKSLTDLSSTLTFSSVPLDKAEIYRNLIKSLIPEDLNSLLSSRYPELTPTYFIDHAYPQDVNIGIELLLEELLFQFNVIKTTAWKDTKEPLIPSELSLRYSYNLLSLLETMLLHDVDDRTTVSSIIATSLPQMPCNAMTPLMIAAQEGDIHTVEQLIGEHSRKCDQNYNTALMHAILARQYNTALLLAPYEAGAINNDGENASFLLLKVCEDADHPITEVERSLVHKLLSIIVPRESKWAFAENKTLLMYAASANKMLFVEQLTAEESLLLDANSMCSAAHALCSFAKEAFHHLVEREKHLLLASGYTPLMLAAASNNVVELEEILHSACANIRQYSPAGYTSLMLAVRMKSLEAVKILANYEAGMQFERSQQTALMFAIEMCQEEMAMVLIEKESGYKTFNGKTALMCAAEHNLVNVAQALLDSEGGAKDLQMTTALMISVTFNNVRVTEVLSAREAAIINREGLTALMLAARENKVEAILVLLPFEASIKSPIGGFTALMHAVNLGNIDAVYILARFEPGIRNQANERACDIARKKGMHDLASFLDKYEIFERHEDGLTPLMIDSIRNDVISIERYISLSLAGASLDSPSQLKLRDNCGKTALIHAIENEAIEAATLLLDHEIGCQDHSGYCALYYSLFMKKRLNNDVLCKLFDAEKTILERTGFSPMMMSVLMQNTMLVSIQLEKYAGLVTKDGYTALMLAAILGHGEIARLLCPFESGRQTNTGYTALMFAAERNHLDVAIALIEVGREFGMQEVTGWTALMIAAKSGYLELVALLAPYEWGYSDCMGCTALFRAVQGNYFDVVQVLADYEVGLCTTSLHPKGSGWSPLFEAIYNGYPNCVAFLLEIEVNLLHHSNQDLLLCIHNQLPNIPIERRLLCKSIVYEFISKSQSHSNLNK